MDGRYTYALMGPTSEYMVMCEMQPDTFVEVLRGAFEAIGVCLDDLVLRIYVQEGAGGWQLIHGRVKDMREAQQTCLLPMPPEPTSADPPNVLDDATYQEIGYGALNLYRTLWQYRKRIKASSLQTKVRVRQSLRALDERMRLVEQAVEGTEWWELFRLRYQQGKKLVACALELHMSSRTLNREISDMAVHVGRMLTTVLKERELAELMEAAKRAPTMPTRMGRVVRLEQRALWSEVKGS